MIPPLLESKFFCFAPRNRIITNTFKTKTTSLHGSMISSYSMAPSILLNPVKEIDETNMDLASSTKYISETDFNSHTSANKKQIEKRPSLMQMLMNPPQEQKFPNFFGVDKRRLSAPTQPFMKFGTKFEGDDPRKLRFKTSTENQNQYKYDQSIIFLNQSKLIK